MSTHEHLSQALITLQQASAADMANEIVSAMELYGAAVNRLGEVLHYLPESCQPTVAHHMSAANGRLAELRAEKNRKGSSNIPRFNHEFVPHSSPAGMDTAFLCPSASVNRPFWLMQLLSKSMQAGAFISPDLYISKQIWYQEGAAGHVRQIGAKVRYLSSMCELMEPLGSIGNSLHDSQLVLRHLDAFLKGAEEIRTAFDSETGNKSSSGHASLGAQKSIIGRGMSSLFSKGSSMLWGKRSDHDATYNSYLAWAANALEQGLLFDRWVSYFTQLGATTSQKNIALIFERLHRVSATLFFGCCTFLLQDALSLAERFAEKGRESASRLLPCDLKIDD